MFFHVCLKHDQTSAKEHIYDRCMHNNNQYCSNCFDFQKNV